MVSIEALMSTNTVKVFDLVYFSFEFRVLHLHLFHERTHLVHLLLKCLKTTVWLTIFPELGESTGATDQVLAVLLVGLPIISLNTLATTIRTICIHLGTLVLYVSTEWFIEIVLFTARAGELLLINEHFEVLVDSSGVGVELLVTSWT